MWETGWLPRQTLAGEITAGPGLPSRTVSQPRGNANTDPVPPWPSELCLPNCHCWGPEERLRPGAGHTAPLGQTVARSGDFPWSADPRRPFSSFCLRCGEGRRLCEINKCNSSEDQRRLMAWSSRKGVGHHPLLWGDIPGRQGSWKTSW